MCNRPSIPMATLQHVRRNPRQGACRRAAQPGRGARAAGIGRPGGAGAGGRRGDAPPAPRAVPHLQRRSKHQLHERLHERLPLLRVLAPAWRRGRLRALRDELYCKIEETIGLGGDQILLQGGLHPELTIAWYEDLLRDVKRRFPPINIHGFSPPEIHHIATVSGLPIRGVLERLRAAGLGSLPGGGAEILVDRVRRQVSPCKATADRWLEVCRTWHELGGRGSATMMFGHVETLAERIEHLDRLRRLQDETGGFTAFIAWTFQPEHTALAGLPKAGAFAYLKTLAVARLYLDNFDHLQASWVTQGLAGRAIGPAVRGQRFRQRDDRGERGGRRRDVVPRHERRSAGRSRRRVLRLAGGMCSMRYNSHVGWLLAITHAVGWLLATTPPGRPA